MVSTGTGYSGYSGHSGHSGAENVGRHLALFFSLLPLPLLASSTSQSQDVSQHYRRPFCRRGGILFGRCMVTDRSQLLTVCATDVGEGDPFCHGEDLTA